jgi:hypothetical protein
MIRIIADGIIGFNNLKEGQKMKLAKRLISLLLACLMFGGVIAMAVDESQANSYDVSDARREELYNKAVKAIEDGDYRPGVAVVTLKSVVSSAITTPFNKVYAQPEEFAELLPELSELDIESIEVKNGEKSTTLYITLVDKSGDAVLNALDLLKVNPNVEWVYVDVLAYPDVVSFPMGDVDSDTKVTNSDLILIARCVVDLVDLSGAQKLRADVDLDGSVTNSDLIIVAKKVVGID